jgi:hypothetical protein
MKRIRKTIYSTDEGRELLTMKEDSVCVAYFSCGLTATELRELASACEAAAEELEAVQPVKEIAPLTNKSER